MDEMDMFLSADADNTDQALKMAGNFSLSPRVNRAPPPLAQAPEPTRPTPEPPLVFNLVTSDKHGGYAMVFSHKRIEHLRRVLQDSGILDLVIDDVCELVLAGSSRTQDPEEQITRQAFHTAMSGTLRWKPHVPLEGRTSMTGLLDAIFACFDREGNSKASVTEVACGITVFCQGKKSDKLEHSFELLDQKKRGKLSRREMTKYFQSFLTVLLGISVCPCLAYDASVDALQTLGGDRVDRTPTNVARAAKAGAEWATSLIFRETQKPSNAFLTFDDFAAWYTSKGHISIPWLELIDLRKWVLQSS